MVSTPHARSKPSTAEPLILACPQGILLNYLRRKICWIIVIRGSRGLKSKTQSSRFNSRFIYGRALQIAAVDQQYCLKRLHCNSREQFDLRVTNNKLNMFHWQCVLGLENLRILQEKANLKHKLKPWTAYRRLRAIGNSHELSSLPGLMISLVYPLLMNADNAQMTRIHVLSSSKKSFFLRKQICLHNSHVYKTP